MKIIKALLLISIILISVLAQQAAAEENDPGIIPRLIALGFDEILRSLGNQIYSLAGAGNQTETNQYMTDLIIGSNAGFIDNQFVRDMKDFNAFWYAVFYLMFIFIGAIIVWRHNADPLPQNGFGFYNEFLDGEKYVKTIIWGLIIFLFVYFGVDYIFKIEWLISQGIALETFNLIPPINQNATGYLGGAIIYAGMSVFFLYRFFVVGLTTAFILFLLGLYMFPYLRGIIKEILSYALLLLFARFFIAIAMAGGIALIQALPFGLKDSPFPHLILGFLVSILGIAFILGPFTFLRWAKNGLKTIAVIG